MCFVFFAQRSPFYRAVEIKIDLLSMQFKIVQSVNLINYVVKVVCDELTDETKKKERKKLN